MGKREIMFDPATRPVHSHLDPLVDLLIANGNAVTTPFIWGDNRTGFYCHLSGAVDFDLIEREFSLPSFIRLDRESGAIECDQTWVSIRGGMGARHDR